MQEVGDAHLSHAALRQGSRLEVDWQRQVTDDRAPCFCVDQDTVVRGAIDEQGSCHEDSPAGIAVRVQRTACGAVLLCPEEKGCGGRVAVVIEVVGAEVVGVSTL